jgi:hypothetical protein
MVSEIFATLRIGKAAKRNVKNFRDENYKNYEINCKVKLNVCTPNVKKKLFSFHVLLFYGDV